MSAIVAAAGLMGAGYADAAAGWQATVLPRPTAYPNAQVLLNGTDGKGGYSGTIQTDEANKLIIWRNGRPVVVNPPAGCPHAGAVGENASGVIAVTAVCGTDWVNRAFTYSNGRYRALNAVSGYSGTWALAINDRGDVLGQVGDRFPDSTVVWPANTSDPVVLPLTAGQQPVDIDDDGTVLLRDVDGPYLWRDDTGPVERLDTDGHQFVNVYAIAGGAVVGDAGDGNGQSPYWWPTPNSPRPLPGTTYAPLDINSSGLAAGDLLTWQDGVPAGELPLVGAFTGRANEVADNGTVLGSLNCDCGYTGYGIPVVWRQG